MVIEFGETTIESIPAVPSSVIKTGVTRVQITANKRLLIKAAGEEQIDVNVPHGKVWDTEIMVRIKETDA